MKLYTDDEVFYAARMAINAKSAKAGGMRSGLAQLDGAKPSLALNLAKDDLSDDSCASDAGDTKLPADASCKHSDDGHIPRALDDAKARPAHSKSRSPIKSSMAMGSSGEVDQHQSVRMRHRSPPRSWMRGGSRVDVSDMASLVALDSDAKSRVKPPSYWLAMVTEIGAVGGKKYTRELSWAQDCVGREARSGNGMQPEVICPHLTTHHNITSHTTTTHNHTQPNLYRTPYHPFTTQRNAARPNPAEHHSTQASPVQPQPNPSSALQAHRLVLRIEDVTKAIA